MNIVQEIMLEKKQKNNPRSKISSIIEYIQGLTIFSFLGYVLARSFFAEIW